MSRRPHALVLTKEPPPLARLDGAETTAHVREYLTFRLADEVYGLPLGSVHEILRVPAISEVPRAPGHVLGIISVRGAITTVIDLRRRLRVADAAPDRAARILLVRHDGETVGLLVDRVEQVERLPDTQIEYRAALSGDTADYIQGIGRRELEPESGEAAPKTDRGGGRAHGAPRTDGLLILLEPDSLLGGGP